MSGVTVEHIFIGKPTEVFAAVRKYDRYPEFLPGVTGVEVLDPKSDGSVCRVKYELKVIKEFFYILDMYEDKSKKIWWELVDSNIMSRNAGSWEFSRSGTGKTKAVYSLDLGFKLFVPSMVVNNVAKAQLAAMFEGFQRMVNE